MNYIAWALTGMAGYSLVTLFVVLATRSGHFSGFPVLAIVSVMVAIVAMTIAIGRGDMRCLPGGRRRPFLISCDRNCIDHCGDLCLSSFVVRAGQYRRLDLRHVYHWRVHALHAGAS
jgi:hypothetical protein